MKKYLLLSAISFSLLACGPGTTIQKSFKEPSSTKQMNDFTKVLVVAFAQSETGRRQAETQIAGLLKGAGVPSYSYKVTVEKGADAQAVEDAMKADGFDGAIVMRLIDKEKETSYVPGTTYYGGGFRGYYGYGYGAYSSPGYYVEDKIYYIETNIYDLKTEKLLWSAVTATTNPSKMDKTINEIADVLANQMRKDGFLK